MRIKILIYALCILLIMLLQSTVFNYIEILGVKPNLVIVFIVSVALLRGNVEGMAVGFFTGISQDLLFGRAIGLYALLGLYLGLIIGSVNKRLYRENFLVIIFFTFISTVAYEFAVYLCHGFEALINGRSSILYALRAVVFPEAVYNSAVSIFVYIFIFKLNHLFEGLSKAARKY